MKPINLVLALLALCSINANGFARGGSSSVGVPNPASQFCIQVGGQEVFVSDSVGAWSFCKLGGGLIEEFTLMRGTEQSQAAALYLNPVAPGPLHGNPSYDYCSANGGDPAEVAVDGSDESIGYCRFADGSIIELWTLFRGARDDANAELTRALGLEGGRAAPVALNEADSAYLLKRLQILGVQPDPVVGALTLRASGIGCDAAHCSVNHDGDAQDDITGLAARQVANILKRAVGRPLAYDVVCSKPVVLRPKAHCTVRPPQ